MDFVFTDALAVAAFDKLLASGGNLDDGDVEFLFRHIVPPPSKLVVL